jgi:hypothetical protein
MQRAPFFLLKEKESVIKLMKKSFFTFIFFLFFASNVSEIFACDCAILTDPNLQVLVNEGYTRASAVFSGKVIKIDKKPNNNFIKITFKVGKFWKRTLENEVVVTTTNSDEDCGYNFKVGEKYLVYAYGDKDGLNADICNRTSLLKSNKDIQALNKIEKSKIKFFPK